MRAYYDNLRAAPGGSRFPFNRVFEKRGGMMKKVTVIEDKIPSDEEASPEDAPPAADENSNRKPLDRRSGNDRRQRYSLDYFEKGGKERRKKKKERRNPSERRDKWVRVTDWSSVYVEDD
jgi:hypothetical protein